MRALRHCVPALLLLLIGPRPGGALVVTEAAGPPFTIAANSAHPQALFAFGEWATVSKWVNPMIGGAPLLNVDGFDQTTFPVRDLTVTSVGFGDPAAGVSDEHMLVVYGTSAPPGGVNMLWAALYDEAGTQLDLEMILSNTADNQYEDLAVATDPSSGNFFVVWRHDDLSNNGNVWGKLITVVGDQIAGPAGGTFIGAWYQDQNLDVAYAASIEPPGGPIGVLHERFMVVYRHGLNTIIEYVDPASGTALGLDQTVGTNTVGPPRIASRGGECLVVWPGSTEVNGQLVRPSTVLEGSTISVGAVAARADVGASDTEYLVAMLHDGAGANDDIAAQYVSFGGVLLDSAFPVVAPFGVGNPSVASDGESFLVTYTQDNTQGPPSGLDVRGQRIAAGVFTFLDSEVNDAVADPTRGVAWGDWRWPDYTDLYVANTAGTMDRPYQNDEGDIRYDFTAGALDVGNSQGVALADMDNDGDLDMYVTHDGQPNELWRQDGNGFNPNFNAVGAVLGVDDGATGGYDSRTAAFADVNNDGFVDIAVANKFARNGLFLSSGGTSFTDASAQLGGFTANSEGLSFVDIDVDGDLDLYVGNAGSANRLFINEGGVFSGDQAPVYNLDDTGSARSVTWVDVDGDGDQDLFISKYLEGNALYRNDGGSFVEASLTFGLADAGRSESGCFADIDLDGDMDLFLANFNDPDKLYRNDNGSFTKISSFTGMDDGGPSLGAAWSDVDQDGDPDLCLGMYGGTNRVLLNDIQNENDWLQIELDGDTMNASAIGARVEVDHGGKRLTQWVGAGSGYLSQNDLRLIFGLGDLGPGLTFVDVTVHWPGGGSELFQNVITNARVTLTRGSGTVTAAELPAREFFRLADNAPNPFNPTTSIAYALPEAGEAELKVFDLRGREVVTLATGWHRAGPHVANWDGRDAAGMTVASGVYLYRLETGGLSAVKRMTMVK